ncbi:MAG TPA: dienelactone hydrolase family protein [Burkholderiales bacterium]
MTARLAALAIFLLLLGCAAISGPSITTTAPDGSAEQIPAKTHKPEGSGPFPAVVMMHDCSGLGLNSSGAPERWAKELVARGYVVAIPDSFTTRGYPGGVCTDASPGRAGVNPYRRARDAYAALAHLRTLPYVDGRRVGLMGGSHGGSATLASMVESESDTEPLARAKRAGFSAAVALYPGCAARLGGWRADASGVYKPVAPVLILIGEADDWTPAEPCRKLAEAAQKARYPVTIKVYPGAYHAFDSSNPPRYVATRVNANSSTGRGATTGGNPEAWADSIREVAVFFDRYLVRADR